MVVPIRPASLLPAVKCSSCKADIEISLMSDHICSERGAAFSRIRAPSYDHNDTGEQKSSQETEPTLDHGGHATPRTLYPRGNSDPPAANLHFAPRGYTLVTPVGTKAAATLPEPSSNGRVPAHPMLLRSTTAPVPKLYQPYPPDLPSNLECAFPPFPTNRVQRTRTPSPINPKPHRPSESALDTPGHDPSSSPLSLRTTATGSANVLRRMNAIIPGPFDTRKRNEGRCDGAVQRTGFKEHSRTSTMSSDGSLEGRPSSDADARSRRPYVAALDNSSLSLRYSDSGHSVLVDLSGVPLPSGPPPPRPATPETLEGFLHQLKEDDKVLHPGQLRVEQGSITFPAAAALTTSHGYSRPVGLRTPSGLATGSGPQTSASDTKPAPHLRGRRREEPTLKLPEQSESPPVKQPGMVPLRNASSKGHGSKPEFDASLIPLQSMLDDPGGHGSHPSSASASSLGSDYSYIAGHSKRSSPASLHASSITASRHPLSTAVEDRDDPSHAPQADFSAQQGVNQSPQMFQSPATQVTKPSGLSFIRPRPAEPSASSRREVSVEAPESPLDPALHCGGRRSRVDDEHSLTERGSAPGTSQIAALADQIIPTLETLNGRPRTTFNGTCRGCGKAIRGKSVKAADGRLTGRYHKHCFVCKTCSKPFQTVDFYVLDNNPYCERHYHTLNGSLCQSCDEGIEGQYLETQSKRKFHPRCFTCRDCHKILLHDYYELSTDVFHCERHALRAAQQSTLLGLNRRNPERRATRLMVMAV